MRAVPESAATASLAAAPRWPRHSRSSSDRYQFLLKISEAFFFQRAGQQKPVSSNEIIYMDRSDVPGSGMTGGEAPEEARVDRMTSPGKVCCARTGTGRPAATCAPGAGANRNSYPEQGISPSEHRAKFRSH